VPPTIDLDRERRLQAFLREAAARSLPTAAQDVSAGGLAVALAEMAAWGGRGAHVRIATTSSAAVELFGEAPSRAIVTAHPRHAPALLLLARQHGLPATEIGDVAGDRLVVELAGGSTTGGAEERGGSVADAIDVPIADLVRARETGLPRALGLDAEGAS
jgi:phosphoribosylformylglycinamidine synthase